VKYCNNLGKTKQDIIMISIWCASNDEFEPS